MSNGERPRRAAGFRQYLLKSVTLPLQIILAAFLPGRFTTPEGRPRIIRTLDEIVVTAYRRTGVDLFYEGNIAFDREQWQEALIHFQQAQNILGRLSPVIHNNLAAAYAMTDDLENARRHIKEAHNIFFIILKRVSSEERDIINRNYYLLIGL
jgi:tetratricopeptide (TPR) repeat protein